MHRFTSVLLAAGLFALLLLVSGGAAQDHDAAPGTPAGDNRGDNAAIGRDAPAPPPQSDDELQRTAARITVGDQTIDYTATCGRMTLASEEGKPRAEFFFISYVRQLPAGADPAARPVTFTFNGGPGSSSVWLHLGAFGPRRIDMGKEGLDAQPPYRVLDNAHSLLDATDLVFIDPVSTGYSRAAEGEKPGQFHGLEEDIASVGEFIHLWTNRNRRWASPKFLAGESYGTTRAAGLAEHLQDRYGMYLNGILLISAILNFQTARFDEGNDLPYILFLPTYTATAWFHGKLSPDLQKKPLKDVVEEARKFATTDYTLALMAGDGLTDSSRRSVAYRVARYTGLSHEYVQDCDLRIHISRFCAELRRNDRLTVGRLDSRFTGHSRDAAGERPDYDPSMAAIMGPYGTAFNRYVRDELGFDSDLPYEILTGRVHPWSYRRYENRYVNVAPRLRGAMTKNPHLKVFVANGYYDLATPFAATEYTFSHLGIPADRRGNVSMAYYESGHMMYIREADLAGLHRDAAAFIRASVPAHDNGTADGPASNE